jgi:hypothetical protein
MNERLALKNWTHYKECNWLLTHFLSKDETKNIDEKLEFYFLHRHEREDSEWIATGKENWSKQTQEEYQDYLYRKGMYEDFLECGGEGNPHIAYVDFTPNRYFDNIDEDDKTDRVAVLTKKMIRNIRMKTKLREIDSVSLYRSDLDAIKQAKKEYKLTEMQTQILFGFIFFSRMNEVKYCRVGTEYKWKSFKACFEKTVTAKDIDAVLNTGLIERAKSDSKQSAYKKLKEQAKYLNIKAESDYVYTQFENQDEVTYTFVTTVENNRLNLSAVAKEAIPDFKIKYCSVCGKEFEPKSNRQKMCEECKKEITKEQNRARQRKHNALRIK